MAGVAAIDLKFIGSYVVDLLVDALAGVTMVPITGIGLEMLAGVDANVLKFDIPASLEESSALFC